MPLPLNLAMTPSEIAAAPSLPTAFAWMACHFSAGGAGLEDLPAQLPEDALLILDDSIPCNGHSAGLAVEILTELVSRFHCCGVLLDFQRPGNAKSASIAAALTEKLPCPVAVTPAYASALPCPVFLPPVPLHIPLKKYLQPWTGREIWLEAALCQEVITVTKNGTTFALDYSSEHPPSGFFSEKLGCCYVSKVQEDRITFTLFDTPETLEKKLEYAHSLGVTRAVGLYQELGAFLTGKYDSDRSIADSAKPCYHKAIKDL